MKDQFTRLEAMILAKSFSEIKVPVTGSTKVAPSLSPFFQPVSSNQVDGISAVASNVLQSASGSTSSLQDIF